MSKIKSHLGCFLMLLSVAMGINSVSATTFRLERVTSVEAGSSYVFEQDGHVMNNTITSNALETTDTYKTTGLAGKESYVWKIEAYKGYYVLQNVSISGNNNYLTTPNRDANLGWSSKTGSVLWEVVPQDDGTVIIMEHGTRRFLGYTGATSYIYKAYADTNKYPHAIIAYKLVEEVEGEEKEDDAVATPAFSPVGGTYTTAQNVEITCATEGASIYYTTDGTQPIGDGDLLYSNPILVEKTTTLKAVAIKGDCVSEIATATFTITSVSDEETLKDPGFFFEKEKVYVNKNEEAFVAPVLHYAEGYDGTVRYSSSDEKVATVDATTGAITIRGGGKTTISATAEETPNFYAATASYTLVVTDDEGGQGEDIEDGVFDFTKGYDYGSGMKLKDQPTELDQSERTWTAGNVTLKTCGRVRWSGSALYLYKQSDGTDIVGTCEFSVPDGYMITSIAITGNDLIQNLIIDSGKLDGDTWTGNAQTVTMKHVGKDKDVGGITFTRLVVTYVPTFVEVEVGTTEYVTFCSEHAIDFTSTPEVTAYVVAEVSETAAVLKDFQAVPANTPVVLHAPAGTYRLQMTDSAADVGANYLYVSDGNVAGGSDIYALAAYDGTVGFYAVSSDITIPAGKCYLKTEGISMAKLELHFGVLDAVSGVCTDGQDGDDRVYYDLSGRPTLRPESGIYILNGKKVMVK